MAPVGLIRAVPAGVVKVAFLSVPDSRPKIRNSVQNSLVFLRRYVLQFRDVDYITEQMGCQAVHIMKLGVCSQGLIPQPKNQIENSTLLGKEMADNDLFMATNSFLRSAALLLLATILLMPTSTKSLMINMAITSAMMRSHTALRSTPMPTSPLPRQSGKRILFLVTKQPSAGTSNKGKSLANTTHVAKRITPAAPIANNSSRLSSAEGITKNSFSPESQSAFEALKRKRESMTLRQTMKKAKFSLCGLGETTANSCLTDQRLRVLASAMTVWEMLKEPVENSEIPEDLLDLLYNLEENV
ncbi:hypothetical protein OUZ56_005617 [Daphnia magna]|uniref:Uncharacterized protein n=1 Tax=Daphnia magna TaxID=35525 RepID=A0ABQ9YTK2_9CRUS|nr:hypothetical protein OUZ56_005617 [Daphnia magna]